MSETLGQVTYAILSSSLGASEFVLGLVVAAGFMVSGVKTLVSRGEPDWDERLVGRAEPDWNEHRS